MPAKISDFFLKAVSAAKVESSITRSNVQKVIGSTNKTSVTAGEETAVMMNKKGAESSGDGLEKLESGLPSTATASTSMSSEAHLQIKVFNKENEVQHDSLEVGKQGEKTVNLVKTKEVKKVTAVIEAKKALYSEVPSMVPVVPTKEGTLKHLLSLIVDSSWKRALNMELRKEYMHNIVMFLEKEKAKGVTVFPPRNLIFNAFNLTPLNQIRVVLIGQDPYHGEGQAHGLCFSVNKGIRIPPSLVNMYKELKTDIPSFTIPNHGCLVSWARQGVFMLNATLTVEAHKANSHSSIGWQKFTDEVIRIISRECKGVVFLLWGGFAHKKESLVDRKKHTILKTAHPSPLSARMFFGCRCFSKTNDALAKLGRPPIDWKTL